LDIGLYNLFSGWRTGNSVLISELICKLSLEWIYCICWIAIESVWRKQQTNENIHDLAYQGLICLDISAISVAEGPFS